ncbi:ABC transporter ATP-binding protein [Thalassotalea ganghwensis]
MLSISNISKYYGHQQVLADMSMVFSERRTCIVGPNGSGKTTLLFILAGIEKPDAGQVLWQGSAVTKPQKISAIASDAISIPGFLTVKKLLSLTQSMWQTEFPQKLLSAFALDLHLHKKISQLSAGNLKKTQLVNAFMRNPEVLLLDEPNIALDDKSCNVLFEAIQEYQGTVVVASNEPERFADLGFCFHAVNNDQ